MNRPWSTRIARLFKNAKSKKTNQPTRVKPRLSVESLEDRVVPASTITVVETANVSFGTNLDSFLTDGTPGVILAGDGGNTPGFVTRAALQAVPAGTNISVTAQNSIIFDAGLAAPVVLAQTGSLDQFIAANGSISFASQAQSLTTAGAALTLQASDQISLGALATNNGTIRLIGDRLDLGSTINAGTGRVQLEQSTPSRIITLGTQDVIGTSVGITNTELAGITASVVQVGNNANTGGIQITGAISQPAGFSTLSLITGNATATAITQTAPLVVDSVAIRAPGSVILTNAGNDVENFAVQVTGIAASDLRFTDVDSLLLSTVDGISGLVVADEITLNAGGIVSQAAGANIINANLELLGTGPYILNNAGNDTTTLAANLTAAGTGTLSYTDSNSLTVGAVNGTVGVTTNNANITLTTINGNLTNTNGVVGTDIDAGSGIVTLTAQSTGAQNNQIIQQNNGGAGINGTGGVVLTADNIVILGGPITAGASVALLQPFQAGTLIDLGGADVNVGTPGTLGLTMAEINSVTAGIIRVGNATAGNILNSLPITVTGTSQLELFTGAQINGAVGSGLTVPKLALTAGTGVGPGGALGGTVSNLEATTDTGGITFVNSGTPLTIGGVNAILTGVRATTSGDIIVSNTASITVGTGAPVSIEGVSTAGGGSISLIATNGGDITVNGAVGTVGGNGNISITAQGAIVVAAPLSTVLLGNITVTADTDLNAVGNGSNTGAGTITTAGGDINFTGSGVNIAAALLATTGDGDITVRSTGPVNRNVNIQTGGTITTTGTTGDIVLTGQVDVNVAAAVSAGGAGTITVSANSDDNSSGVFTSTAAGMLSTAGGNITVNAFDMTIGGTINAGTGIVTLRQSGTATEDITLGGPTSIPLTPVNETEPNDSRAGAQALGAIGFSTAFSISATGDGTFDYYSFTILSPITLRFTISAGNFDTELFLYDSAGNLLTANDDFNGTLSQITFTFTTPGTYVIAVGRFPSNDNGAGTVVGTAPQPGETYTLVVTPPSPRLALSDAELDLVTASVLRIGRTNNTGNILVSSQITQAGSGYTTMSLLTGGAVVDDTAGEQTDLTVNNLAITAATGIPVNGNGQIETSVSNLAALNSSATGGIFIVNAVPLTIARNIDGVTGLTTNGTNNGVIDLINTGAVMIDAPVAATGGGAILLTTTGAGADITLTTMGSVTATGGSGSIILDTSGATSGGAITLNNGPNAVDISAAGTGNILLNARDAVTLAAGVKVQSGDNATGGDITVNANVGVAGGGADITLNANSSLQTRGNVSLSTDPDNTFTGTAQANIVMDPTSSIKGPGNTAATNTVATATLRADGDITVSSVISLGLASLTAAGNILDDSAATTTDATFIQGSGITLAAGGRIGGFTAINPVDVFSGNTATPTTEFRGAIDYDLDGGVLIISQGANVVANGTGGNVQLRQVDDVLDVNPEPVLTSTFNFTNAVINAGNQLALISSAGNLQVNNGFVVPSNANALLATVNGFSVQVTTGAINNPGATATTTLVASGGPGANIDGPAAPDGTADIVGTNLNLITTGGTIGAVGSAGATALEINVVRLDGDTTGGGSAPTGGTTTLIDTQNGISIGRFTTGTVGDFTLTSQGNILGGSSIIGISPNDGVAEVVGDVVTLAATGTSTANTGQIGFFNVTPQFFEVDANTLNARTNDSRLWISDVAGGVVVDGSLNGNTGGVRAGTNTAFVRVRNGGSLTSVVGGAADIIAATVNLSAPEGGNFGTSTASPLEIDAATALVANVTGNGNISIKDTAGGLPSATAVVTGTGNISLATVGGALTVTKATTAGGTFDATSAAALILGDATSTTAVVTATTTATLTAAGSITSGVTGSAFDVVAATLNINNSTGANSVGLSANPLETDVDILSATTGSGGVFVNNTGALALNGVTTTTVGNIAITTIDTVATGVAGENLTVNASTVVTSGSGTIKLQSGDDITVNGSITTTGVITLSGDFQISPNPDPDAAGTTITVAAGGSLSTAAGVVMNGNTGLDTFNTRTFAATPLTINGNNPTTAPGDTLNLTLTGLNPTFASTGVGSGTITTTNGLVTFSGIETTNFTGATVAVALDLTTLGFQNVIANPDVVNVSVTAGVLNVTVQDNGGSAVSIFSGAVSGVSSLAITGSIDRETIIIDETNMPASLPITINGGAPTTSPGDTLVVNTTNATGAVAAPGAPGAGTITFTNRGTITYTGIESVTNAIITIAATDTTAAERGVEQAPDAGVITLTRFGDPSAPLTVNYTISGSAVNGKDYQTIAAGSVTFAAGSSTATININAINNSLVDGTRTVTVTLAAGAGYTFVAGASATVSIVDNDKVQSRFATSVAAGSGVAVFDNGSSVPTVLFAPYPEFGGVGAAVAVGDVNGDGVADIATVMSAGGPALVRVFDGATGALRLQFFAVSPGYTGGASIAVGDVDGDGRGEIVVGFSGFGVFGVFDGLTGGFRAAAAPFGGAPVGINVAVGDLDGDGKAEIIATPTGQAPIVTIFDGNANFRGAFFAFNPVLAGVGLTVGAADLNGDGRAELIFGANINGTPAVLVYNSDLSPRVAFALPVFVPNTISAAGPQVSGADLNGDGAEDLLVTDGIFFAAFDGKGLNLLSAFAPFPGSASGVYVG